MQKKKSDRQKKENNLPGFGEENFCFHSSIRYDVAVHAAGCEAVARLEEGKRRVVDRREMVGESGQESGEKIEKERRLGGTGKGDLNTKLSHQMRHHSEVIEFIFTFSLEHTYIFRIGLCRRRGDLFLLRPMFLRLSVCL